MMSPFQGLRSSSAACFYNTFNPSGLYPEAVFETKFVATF
jgi:hypothetical protein